MFGFKKFWKKILGKENIKKSKKKVKMKNNLNPIIFS